MSALGLVVRWLHLASCLVLAGGFLMLLLAGRSDRPTARAWAAAVLRWSRWLAGLVLVSGIASLAGQAAVATGRPGAALDPVVWVDVLARTQFGTVWLVRHGLLLLLAALVVLRQREDSAADWAAFRAESALLGAASLGALAWAGHAASVESWGLAAVLADAVHLLAAAAWLGSLPALAALLRATSREAGSDARPYAVLAVYRFSAMALPAMLVLLGTGAASTWAQVEDVPSLIGTPYGAMILLKVALATGIVVVAARSRRRLLPALSGDGPTVGRPAMAGLARAVRVELALGLLIVAVVSALSVTPPGRHESPRWPLSWRLDYASTIELPGVRTRLLIGSQVATAGLLAAVVGVLARRRRGPLLGGGIAAVAVGLWVALPPLAVDAYPTTYRRTPVPYTALSIARGLELYRADCAVCHGPSGTGDGPGGAGLPRRPADLTAPHTSQHTAGDIFWWLTHGIPRSGMPGFGDAMSVEDRWDIVNFLRALSAADQARLLGEVIERDQPWLAAPDFSFSVGPTASRMLKDFRGRPVVLVLFTLPESRPRLAEIAQAYDMLRGLGAEVIAVPMDGAGEIIARLGARPPILFPVATEGAADIAQAYILFRRAPTPEGILPEPPVPPHMEFLIDRQGYIRARTIAAGAGARWPDTARLAHEIQQLNRETPSAPPPDEHVH
ncbi:MAG TPA: CopD family protein [Candidatus Binatia bacterium]|nr:CopD family protein [Candidatus Binatia bacterium]